MTPDQIAQGALEAISAGTHVTLTLPRGAQRKLPGFPRGELLCETNDGRNVRSYDPHRILKWLHGNNLI